MPVWLAHLLMRYGYVCVFAGVFLESTGLPIPGETALLAGAFFAQQGYLSLPWIIGVGIAGAILGDNLGYYIGHRGGRPMAERYGPRIGLTGARLAVLDGFFTRHGPKAVFFARFITGVRVFAAFFAGLSRFSWSRFLLYNAAGGIVWATAAGLLGYFFGQSWALLEHWIKRAGLVFAAVVVVVLLFVELVRRYRARAMSWLETWVGPDLPFRTLWLGLAAIGSVSLFIKEAEDVVTGESVGFERVVGAALQQAAAPPLDVVAHGLAVLDSLPVILIVAALGIAWCLGRGERRAASVLAAVEVATGILSMLFQSAFHLARPLMGISAGSHPSAFPSGRAMAVAAIYGMIAVITARLAPRLAHPLWAVTPVLALLTGASRVSLGVSSPSDVLAGIGAGGFLLTLGVYALDPRPRSPTQNTLYP
jgi:membrane protein DedA with SNARE-associated domain